MAYACGTGVQKSGRLADAGMERTPRSMKPENEQNAKRCMAQSLLYKFRRSSTRNLGTKNFIFIQFKFPNHLKVSLLFFFLMY